MISLKVCLKTCNTVYEGFHLFKVFTLPVAG